MLTSGFRAPAIPNTAVSNMTMTRKQRLMTALSSDYLLFGLQSYAFFTTLPKETSFFQNPKRFFKQRKVQLQKRQVELQLRQVELQKRQVELQKRHSCKGSHNVKTAEIPNLKHFFPSVKHSVCRLFCIFAANF